MSFKVSSDVLPGGLTVVTIAAPHLHSAMCAVYVRVGSRHETKGNNGVSHLLEHLFFRGCRRWPDSVHMNAAVEDLGGNLNGFTMRDSSSFFTPAHPGGVRVALAVLGEMLTRPRLIGLQTEKRVILEEMLDEVDDRGRDVDIDNISKEHLFGDHPMALKIAGTPATVGRLTLAQVREHYRRLYVTGNVVVAVAGPVKRAEIVAWTRKAFAHLPRGPRVTEAPTPPPRRDGPKLLFVPLPESQVEFRLSFPAVSEEHPDAMGLSLLRRVLDDGLSSRLPYTIVEKRGLAYSISSVYEAWMDSGAFEVDGACAPGQVAEVVEAVLGILKTLRAGRILRSELVRVKRRFRMHLDFLADAPGELCGWFGGNALFRDPPTFEQKSREAEAVTAKDLTRLARQYLVPDALTVVAVGSRRSKQPLAKVVARAGRLLGVTPIGRP